MRNTVAIDPEDLWLQSYTSAASSKTIVVTDATHPMLTKPVVSLLLVCGVHEPAHIFDDQA